jgi:genome maintenance exonuclease 1
MYKQMQNFIEITDLENLQAKTVSEDGKRMYQFEGMEAKYPSVTTVTGLLNREHIKLWRKRVGEETANKITASATKRGTNFHQLVEDYLRAEKDIIIENDLQRGMFNAMQPVLDEIIPLALEAPLFSPNLEMAGRVDCVGIFDEQLCIIDFKTSSKYKEEYMAKPWFIQMTAYALMVEELTGQAVQECIALVAVEGLNAFQMFVCNPLDYIDDLVQLRKQYKNVYGV